MTDKKIDGSVANYLIDAFEHFARLEEEIRDLKWRICYRDSLKTDGGRKARKHCREMIHAFEMLDHCLREDEAADNKVVSIDEQRKKP